MGDIVVDSMLSVGLEAPSAPAVAVQTKEPVHAGTVIPDEGSARDRLIRVAATGTMTLESIETPLKPAITKEAGEIIASEWERIRDNWDNSDRAYLETTRGLERGTDRTAVLQDIVDRMLVSRGARATVVIMNRGLEPDAFVTPDNTIYISQSMIDMFDTLDEIGCILAHESNHVLLGTANRMRRHGGEGMGVAWSHELASDFTIDLMQEAGLNSMIGVSAIRKLSEADRGPVHQTGLMREAMGVGTHYTIDSRTSTKAATPIPDVLRSVRAMPTLIESYEMALEAKDVERAIGIIDRFHPRDLSKAVHGFVVPDAIEKRLVEVVRDRLSGRFEPVDVDLFVLGVEGTGSGAITDFGSCRTYADNLSERRRDVWPDMQEYAYGTREQTCVYDAVNVVIAATERLAEHEHDIRLAGEAMADVFGRLVATRRTYDDQSRDRSYSLSGLDEVLMSSAIGFVRDRYLRGHQGAPYPKRGIDTFLDSVKAAGIVINPKDHDIREMLAYDFMAKSELIGKDHLAALTRAVEDRWGEKPRTIERRIDDWFAANGPNEGGLLRLDFDAYFDGLLRDVREGVRTDHQAAKAVDAIAKHIDTLPFRGQMTFLEYLDGATPIARRGPGAVRSEPRQERPDDTTFFRYQLKVRSALALFSTDSDAFYAFMRKQSDAIVPLTAGLTYRQRFNLAMPLLQLAGGERTTYWRYGVKVYSTSPPKSTEIRDIGKLLELPEIRSAMSGVPEVSWASIAELNDWVKSEFEHSVHNDFRPGVMITDKKHDLYGTDAVPLVWGASVRRAFASFVEHGIAEQDLPATYTYILSFTKDDGIRRELLNTISQRIIGSDRLGLGDKIDHVIDNIDTLGPEGVFAVAEYMDDIHDFAVFRERLGSKLDAMLLEPSAALDAVAKGDYVISSLLGDYDALLSSMDRARSRELTGELAVEWCKRWVRTEKGKLTNFDTVTQKIDIGSRSAFTSLADGCGYLHDLPHSKRLLIAMRMLTDTKGYFSSPELRHRLADALIHAYGTDTGFVAESLRASIELGDTKYLTFPIANMVAPLLFSAYDVGAIDGSFVRSLPYYRSDTQTVGSVVPDTVNLDHLFTATTRDLYRFGGAYRMRHGETFVRLAADADGEFRGLADSVRALGSTQPDDGPVVGIGQTEGVMRGVEACGAPGIRGMQLSSQLLEFSPAVEARVSESLDANPGMNAYVFRENLLRQQREDPAFSAFITENKLRIHGYLGGGSLQTTYAATVTVGGVERDVVVKMLNPNAAAFIGANHALASGAFGHVMETSADAESRKLAEIAQGMMDMSHSWCLSDINDPTFMEDDAAFSAFIAGHRPQDPDVSFNVPQVLFRSAKITIEDRVSGRTVNALLRDTTVSVPDKRRLVTAIVGLFRAEMSANRAGSTLVPIQSDPHVGNFVADMSPGGPIRIGIIDRTMYLKVPSYGIAPFDALDRGDATGFVAGFVRMAITENKVRNPMRIADVSARVIAEATGSGGRAGDALTVQRMFGALEQVGLTVPLWMRLMIRNVAACKRLEQRYSAYATNNASVEER